MKFQTQRPPVAFSLESGTQIPRPPQTFACKIEMFVMTVTVSVTASTVTAAPNRRQKFKPVSIFFYL